MPDTGERPCYRSCRMARISRPTSLAEANRQTLVDAIVTKNEARNEQHAAAMKTKWDANLSRSQLTDILAALYAPQDPVRDRSLANSSPVPSELASVFSKITAETTPTPPSEGEGHERKTHSNSETRLSPTETEHPRRGLVPAQARLACSPARVRRLLADSRPIISVSSRSRSPTRLQNEMVRATRRCPRYRKRAFIGTLIVFAWKCWRTVANQLGSDGTSEHF